MHSTIYKRSIALSASLLAFAIMLPATIADAQPARAQDAQMQAQERRESAPTSAEEHREAAAGRLENAKLKACQNREKAIQNIMNRVSDRGRKQLDVFTKISERTQAFYAEKGHTLNNYDALVAEVDAKKSAAQAAVDAVHDSSGEFKCDGENPKAVADSFKENLKAMNTALKEYKTAVKDLIVGVKSVQSTTAGEGSTEGGQQ